MIGSRISVVGASGSGKTTVAGVLAARLGFDHIELDALHWGPGWTEAAAADLRRDLEPRLEGYGWIVDGNYGGKARDLVWSRADTVIWLDLSRPSSWPHSPAARCSGSPCGASSGMGIESGWFT